MSQGTLNKVEAMTLKLEPDEQLELVEKVVRRIRERQKRELPKDVRGVWKETFPEDFDIGKAVEEIRYEWLKELDELRPFISRIPMPFSGA